MLDKISFLKHSGLSFIVRALGASIGLIMTVVVTRALPAEEAGVFFLSQAVLIVLGACSALGLTTAFMRFMGGFSAEKNWSVINGVFAFGLKASLVAAVIIGLCLYTASEFLASEIFRNKPLGPAFRIIAFALPFFIVYQLISFAFIGLQKTARGIFLQNICNPILFISLVMLSDFFGVVLNAKSFVAFLCFASLLTALIGVREWFKREESRFSANYSESADLIASAKPLWAAGVMIILIEWSGQIIAGVYVASEQVAFLTSAQRLSLLTTFVLIAVNQVAAPKFAACAKLGKFEDLRLTSLFCSRVMVCIATPILFFMLIFPELLMGLFGEQYKQGANLLRILVIGQFINVITGSVGFLLNMTGFENDMRNIVFLSGAIALLLNFILIPIYGVTGAAIATSIAIALQSLFAVYMVRRRLGFNTLNLIR